MVCTIDRNATLRELFRHYNGDEAHDRAINECCFTVLDVPCENGVGSWVFTDDGFKCSECGECFADVVTGYDAESKKETMWRFCPCCGIAMSGDMREDWVSPYDS